MNILCISFFFFCIFHFYKTANINEVKNVSEVAEQLVDISDQIEQKISNTANSEDGGNSGSNVLENNDPANTKYHDLLPKNNPNITPKKTDRKCDNNEQSSDKKDITSPNDDIAVDLSMTEHKQDISTRPNPQNDSDKPTSSQGGSDPQKSGKKVIFNEYAKYIDAKPTKSKRKHYRKGRKNRAAKDLDPADIEKAKLASIEEKSEEPRSYNQPPDDQPLDLSIKKVLKNEK
ncbi:hypothetical protein YYG_02934 [Plasmodium vinckei petteri]|uniref:Fam-c protein n=1 Tax=Plasmodium vinckei petteri TaxID=138298 RepID=W7B1B4_PLAVN|nr:hypothetical protein YYG_02934 [Plasmodium vinckei petteri]CAD2099262.1 conserved Plasmodium protein, unknown function [Plasmodium vinckei petteri]